MTEASLHNKTPPCTTAGARGSMPAVVLKANRLLLHHTHHTLLIWPRWGGKSTENFAEHVDDRVTEIRSIFGSSMLLAQSGTGGRPVRADL